MSYERDRDAHTRGVGAIAAADGSRIRARRRAQVGRALRDRDRALAQITMGPRGGLMGLGAIKGMTTAASPVLGRNRTMDASPTTGGRGLSTDYTPPRPVGPVAPPPPRPTFSASTVSSTATGGRLVPTTSGGKTFPGGGLDTNTQPSGGNVDPGLLPTTTISDGSDTTSSGGSSGGGSGGGGGGGGGSGVTTGGGSSPTFTDPAVPGEDIPSAGGMSNQTKILIGVGVLGAAYLLFKKKGP